MGDINPVDRFDENSLLAAIIEKWGEYGAHADVFRWMVSEIGRLRELNAELLPFMASDVRDGLTLGPPPDDHADDGCADCLWYAQSLAWQRRIDAGEFGPVSCE